MVRVVIVGSCAYYSGSLVCAIGEKDITRGHGPRVRSSSLLLRASGNLIDWLLMQVNWIVTLLKLKKCEDG